jgi:hypothetical protein
MNAKQIIEAIRGMRERDTLSAIIDAAEARDCHLSNLESDERRKRLWAKFSHLRVSDTVFIHKKPDPESKYWWLWGKPLIVKQVLPRKREIVVRGDPRGTGATLTAIMMDAFKLSEVPTPQALASLLNGGES